MKKCIFFLVWVWCFTKSPYATIVQYSELEELGVSCPPKDKCSGLRSRILDSVKDRNCACDKLCPAYGDCCSDAGHGPLEKRTDYCRILVQYGGIYVKNTCGNEWADEAIHEKCADDPLFRRDPVTLQPVTNRDTGVTYNNYYCAICNNDTINVEIWPVRLQCDALTTYQNKYNNLTKEYVIRNLVFNAQENSWGIWLRYNDSDNLHFEYCYVDPLMPKLLEQKIRLCKPDLIDMCHEDWDDDNVAEKCGSYMSAIYWSSTGYRNPHCAICNKVNISQLSCQSAEMRYFLTRAFQPTAFSILLDITGEEGATVGIMCDDGEIFDSFFKVCRKLICGLSLDSKQSVCNPAADVLPRTNQDLKAQEHSAFIHSTNKENKDGMYIEHSNNSTQSIYSVNFNESTVDYQYENIQENASVDINYVHPASIEMPIKPTNLSLPHFSPKFLNCVKINIEPERYIIFNNSTVYVPAYGKLFESSMYKIENTNLLVCAHILELEVSSKFSAAMGYVTTIGLAVSIIALTLYIFAFCLVPELRNLSGKNLLSLVVSLLLAYVSFIIGQTIYTKQAFCYIIALVIYYFFLSAFLWMNILAFDVWRTVRIATVELRVSTGEHRKRFIVYSVSAWLGALLILITAIVIEKTNALPDDFRPHFGEYHCWFNKRKALLVFFAIPIFLVVITNICLFSLSSKMIISTNRNSVKNQCGGTSRYNYRLYLRLAIIMGLTWVAGIIAAWVDQEFLWYVFVFLNTLQGLFIFIAFGCNKKVMNHFGTKMRSVIWTSECKAQNLNSGVVSSGHMPLQASSSSSSRQPSQTSLSSSTKSCHRTRIM